MQKHSSSKKLSIIIVTYNSSAVIGQCLASIPTGFKVFVVDNASGDDTIEIVKKTAPKATIIANKENVGFGVANNIALEKAKSEFCLLLNPDTVLQNDSIEKLLQAAEQYKEAAIIAPMLYHADGSLQQSYKTSVFSREKNAAKYIEPEGDLCAECLSGAVMLLRMECFKKTGFFDPDIFLFYEDDDICMKAREAGYSLVLTTSARVTHLMGRSSPINLKSIYFKNMHMMWSRIYLEKKYAGNSSAKIFAAKSLYISAFKMFIYMICINNEKATKYRGKVFGALRFLVGG